MMNHLRDVTPERIVKIDNAPNPLLMSKINALNSEILSSTVQHRDSLPDPFSNRNTFNHDFTSPSNKDVSSYNFEEVKSEFDDAEKNDLGVSEIVDHEEILRQLNDKQSPIIIQ